MHYVKSILILLMLVIDTSYGFGFDWHQDSYDIFLHRTEIGFYNKSVFNTLALVSFKLNRKIFAMNATAELTKNIEKHDKGSVNIKAFKYVSNEYRLKLIDFDIDICELVKQEFFGVMAFRTNDGTLLSGCPIQKGKIQMYNKIVDASRFPPNIPAGLYRVQVELALGKVTKAVNANLYGELVYKKRN